MAILVTGGSGFVGSALIPKLIAQGHKVYGLSRHPPSARENLLALPGDITEPNLGLDQVPKDIHAIHHLAGIHSLGEDEDGSIWKTNVDGTQNVIDFCAKHRVSHLFFASTAYTEGRNTYEKSKALCEMMLKESDLPKVTIFKPSIIMGTEEHPYLGHFSQFVLLIIKMHQRADIIRRKLEGTLRLPVLEPVFRIRGNSEGKINLVMVDTVAEGMARIKKVGTYWLTNPSPPTLGELLTWIGEFILLNIKVLPDFKPSPIEAQFHKIAAAFDPYVWGDDFPSNLADCPPITREFIHDTIKRTLLD